MFGDDGELYGRLSVEGVFSLLGRAEMEGLRLDLKWSILIKRGVRILDSDTGEEVGALHLGILRNRGEFVLASGRRFGFKMNMMSSRCTVTDDLGNTQFTTVQSAFRRSVKVLLGSGFASRKDLSVLLAAAQYALVMIDAEAIGG